MSSPRNKPPGCGFAMGLIVGGALLSVGAGGLFLASIWGESAGREVASASFIQGTELILPESQVDPTQECRIGLFHTIESEWAAPMPRSSASAEPRLTARIPYRLTVRTDGSVLHATEGWLNPSPVPPGTADPTPPVKLSAARRAEGFEKKEFQPPESGRIQISLLVGQDERYGARLVSGTCTLHDQVVMRNPALLGGGLLMFVAGPAMFVIGASMGLFALLRKRGH